MFSRRFLVSLALAVYTLAACGGQGLHQLTGCAHVHHAGHLAHFDSHDLAGHDHDHSGQPSAEHTDCRPAFDQHGQDLQPAAAPAFSDEYCSVCTYLAVAQVPALECSWAIELTAVETVGSSLPAMPVSFAGPWYLVRGPPA